MICAGVAFIRRRALDRVFTVQDYHLTGPTLFLVLHCRQQWTQTFLMFTKSSGILHWMKSAWKMYFRNVAEECQSYTLHFSCLKLTLHNLVRDILTNRNHRMLASFITKATNFHFCCFLIIASYPHTKLAATYSIITLHLPLQKFAPTQVEEHSDGSLVLQLIF